MLPWLALLLIFVSGYAGGAKWDKKDTHDRLDRIYKDLGLDGEEEEQGCNKGREPEEERGGCQGCAGCQPKKRCKAPSGKGGAGGGVAGKGGEGKDGKDGKGKDSKDKAGKDGKDGKDGKSAAKADPECEEEPTKLSMPSWLGYLLFGVIIAAMLIPLIFVLRNSYRDKANQPLQADVELEEPRAPTEAALGPWFVDLSECRRLFEQGRLTEAFASLHRLTLLNLEQGRHLTLTETTTNWEYVRRLVSKPALREALSRVTLAAEQSVLGQSPPGPEVYEQLERLVIQRLQEVRS